jgi:hypothetical protein
MLISLRNTHSHHYKLTRISNNIDKSIPRDEEIGNRYSVSKGEAPNLCNKLKAFRFLVSNTPPW